MAHHVTRSTVLLKIIITVQYPREYAYVLQGLSHIATKEFNLSIFCDVI